jgi:hypothetical protein
VTLLEKAKSEAIKMAKEEGTINLTRDAISSRIGIPGGSFQSRLDMKFSEFLALIKDDLPPSTHKLTKKRASKVDRKEAILMIALELSEKVGFNKVIWKDIADEAGVSLGLLVYHFGTMVALRRTIMRAAISRRNLVVLAQGLAVKDEHAKKAPEDLKMEAVALLLGN